VVFEPTNGELLVQIHVSFNITREDGEFIRSERHRGQVLQALAKATTQLVLEDLGGSFFAPASPKNR
jgi:hypothetical protein